MKIRRKPDRRKQATPWKRPRTSDLRDSTRVYKERRYHERRKTDQEK